MSARSTNRLSNRKARMRERTLDKARSLKKTSRILTECVHIQELAEALELHNDTLFNALEKLDENAARLAGSTEQEFETVDILMENTDFAGEAVDTATLAWEETSRTFAELASHGLLLFAAVQGEEPIVLGLKDKLAELVKALEICTTSIDSIRATADRIDVAGLNMGIEAGKKGSQNPAFVFLGEETRAAASRLTQTIARLDGFAAEIKDALDIASASRQNIDERYRTVTVLSKSIGNTVAELDSGLDELFETAETVTFALDENTVAMGSLEDQDAVLADAVEELPPALSYALSTLETTKDSVDMVIDLSRELSLFAEKSEDGDQEILEDLEIILDDFSARMGGSGESFETGARAFDVARTVFDRLSEAKTAAAAVIAAISDNSGSASETLEKLSGLAEDIAGRFESTAEAFDGFIEELDAFRAIELEVVTQLESIDTAALNMISVTDAVSDAATRASFLAVTTRLEAIRMDKGATKYTQQSKELAEISGVLEKAGEELAAHAEALGNAVTSIAGAIMESGKAAGVIEATALRDELSEIAQSLLAPAAHEDVLASDAVLEMLENEKTLAESSKSTSKTVGNMDTAITIAASSLAEFGNGHDAVIDAVDKLAKLLGAMGEEM